MARDSKTQQVLPNWVLMERNHGSASFCQTFPFVSVGCPFNYQHYQSPWFWAVHVQRPGRCSTNRAGQSAGLNGVRPISERWPETKAVFKLLKKLRLTQLNDAQGLCSAGCGLVSASTKLLRPPGKPTETSLNCSHCLRKATPEAGMKSGKRRRRRQQQQQQQQERGRL